MNVDLGRSPLWVLVGANLLPLAGTLLLGWDMALLLALYWAESAVIGAVTILRLLANRTAPLRAKVVAVPFFAFHFGMFMFVHATFLGVALRGMHVGGFGPALLLPYLREPGIPWTLVVLLGSHMWSFAVHDLARGERDRIPLQNVMFRPYPRIIAMHLTLILGLGLAMVLGDSHWLAAVFAVAKTLVDAQAHRRSHRAGNDLQTTPAMAADGPPGPTGPG